MERYALLIQLLATFNALHAGIGTTPMFTYTFKEDRMYIDSYCTANLSALFTVLWSTTKDYCFYMVDNKIEVLNIKPVE